MDQLLGQIFQFAFPFAPSGWAECAGQTLNISNYQALYTLLGTAYGGNGTTTFCLPDMRSAMLFSGMKYYIAIEGFYPSRT